MLGYYAGGRMISVYSLRTKMKNVDEVAVIDLGRPSST